MNRRDLLLGAGCLVAAGGAEAMRPRQHMSLVGGRKIADAIPLAFENWRQMDTNTIVAPETDNSLARKLYSEQVSRLYITPDQAYVMLLIAYGATQDDTLQLHRPEVCYPAFGFQVTETEPTTFDLGGVSLPGRRLTATAAERTEHISYWARIGEYLPQSSGDQRRAKLECAFSGIIPDGVLVRISSTAPDPETSFRLNENFAGAMVRHMRSSMRPALVTTSKANEVDARFGKA